MTPALALQLGLLGSPPDPFGRFTMREGPSTLHQLWTSGATVGYYNKVYLCQAINVPDGIN